MNKPKPRRDSKVVHVSRDQACATWLRNKRTAYVSAWLRLPNDQQIKQLQLLLQDIKISRIPLTLELLLQETITSLEDLLDVPEQDDESVKPPEG